MDPSWMEVKEEADLESPFRFEGLRGKVRFSFAEIKVLLEEVKNHRFVVLKKFNAGVSSETKKQTWAEITDKVNSLGVTVREVRQIMKKWADLKCDARRRMLAMRAPKGHKKTLGPVEVMVQKILLLAPGKDEAELDMESFEEYSRRRPRAKPRGRPRRHSISSPKEEPVEDFYQSSPEMSFDLINDETMPLDFEEQDEPPPDRLARVAAQSLVQQQVGGALLGSVSRSLELLAAAVQQLVETQQDFISESLETQRRTLDPLPPAHYQPLDQNQHLVLKNRPDQNQHLVLKNRPDQNQHLVLKNRPDQNQHLVLKNRPDQNQHLVLKNRPDQNQHLVHKNQPDQNGAS
ncbi:unnamed protein product [Boreogadus saida]